MLNHFQRLLKSKRARGLWSLAFCFWILSGCATYQYKVQDARRLMENGQPSAAAEKLEPLAKKPTDDQLVYLFDYGTALQVAKDYKASTEALLLADQMSEVKDYHSLSRVTGSLLLNEGMVQYKGEDYEKVLVNAMLAINFLMQGDQEAALVETRKLNQKLYRYRYEAKRDYEQNPFAFYLAAMIWESDRKWDDAYIDYKKAYEVAPSIPYLGEDLIRLARLSGRPDELAKWKKAFPNVKEQKEWRDPNYGEIVLIYQQGWGPRKQPHPSFPRIPKLYPVSSLTQEAQLSVEGIGKELSQLVFSVEDVAIKTLDDAYAGLIAKRAAGLAAKAVAADQIRQQNELLGQLAWIGMNIADQADLRQWSTLPESFQVARMWVPAGEYKVSATGLSYGDSPTGARMEPVTVTVKPGRKTFLNWRTF